MSNKPSFMRRPAKDVLVNYAIMKQNDESSDIEAAIGVVANHIHTHPVYYNVEPTMFNGELLFSLIGFPGDQRVAQQAINYKIKQYNCVLRNSEHLPVPKDKKK